jgi:hypothetical protein
VFLTVAHECQLVVFLRPKRFARYCGQQEERGRGAIFPSEHNPLIRKLVSIFTLSDDERQVLLGLLVQLMAPKEYQNIVHEGIGSKYYFRNQFLGCASATSSIIVR